MKRIILSLFFAFVGLCSIAQVQTLPNSIGIGTGINSSIPLHINKNGEVARFQGTWPYATFYDGINMNGYLQAINSTFEIGSKNYYDLNLYTGDAPRININGNNGMVTVNQKLIAQNGIKLTGPLQAQGESVGADGMILVSRGNATPAWEERKIGFSSHLNTSQGFPNYTEGFLSGFQQRFDDGGDNFNPITGVFTVPSSGLYHFKSTAVIAKFVNSDPSINEGIGTIAFYVNSVKKDQKTFTFKTNSSYALFYDAETYLKLNQSDIVTVSFIQINEHLISVGLLGSISTNYGFTSFTGIKIY
ncbi:MAG: hypothetical protein ACOVO2_19615 [Emticicia sp.]|uniref:hypothetical protein n=1 Tax=Emticicia sp. TaxID=1930953 RepID=UPI003BA4F7F0